MFVKKKKKKHFLEVKFWPAQRSLKLLKVQSSPGDWTNQPSTKPVQACPGTENI
jgi:hypothetical protein